MQKINAIKEQLHSLADLIPASDPDTGADSDADSEGGWDNLDPDDDMLGSDDDDDEEDDLELLRATGVIPPSNTVQRKVGKSVDSESAGKGKAHIIFTDVKDERESACISG